MNTRQRLIEVLTGKILKELNERKVEYGDREVIKDIVLNYINSNEDLFQEMYNNSGETTSYLKYKKRVIKDLEEEYETIFATTELDVYDFEALLQTLNFEDFINVNVSDLDFTPTQEMDAL